MSSSDPIADFLTKIRNAKDARHRYVDINYSRNAKSIIEVLKQSGFIENFLVDDSHKRIRIFLKYTKNRESIIQNLRRVSKPGCRRYVGYREIPRVLGGLGISILSTPAGIMTDESARKLKVGGEHICNVM